MAVTKNYFTTEVLIVKNFHNWLTKLFIEYP